jgi:asparagine synthase (glutamine-hydrolysing)
MCGIIGQFSRDPFKIDHSAFERANNEAKHRGPDGFGIYAYSLNSGTSESILNKENSKFGISNDTNLMLGHRRLAIIDLSHGADQPFTSPSGKHVIVFNGEIYNFKEIKNELSALNVKFRTNSDTEVLLNAYIEWGESFVSKLRGMWAFAIHDKDKKLIFCSRDRFGIKPFYYSYVSGVFTFSSEIKQLLTFRHINKEVNDSIVHDYLRFGIHDHTENTFYSSIKNLRPGNNLIFDLTSENLNLRNYYNPKFEVNGEISFKSSVEKFGKIFEDSLEKHLVSDVKVGSLLSGGLDSSAIVSLVCERKIPNGIDCVFSSQFADKAANETEFLYEVVNKFDLNVRINSPSYEDFVDDLDRLLRAQDEPFGSTSIFAQYSLFKKIRLEGYKVILDGQGADELLAGYFGLFPAFNSELKARNSNFKRTWETLLHIRANPDFFLSRIRFSLNKSKYGIYKDLFNEEFISLNEDSSEYLQSNGCLKYPGEEILNNTLYKLFFKNNLPALLRYEDRNSMAHSIESRVPFVDVDLVDFVFTLPSEYKIRNGYTKSLLRHSMRGVLPPKIQWRLSKLGFASPEMDWVYKAYSLFKKDIQTSSFLKRYVDVSKVDELAEFCRKNSLKDFTLWRIINLYLWSNQL